MQLLYIIGIIAIITVISAICIMMDRVIHWAMRRRGVTQLSSRQRRGLAHRYKETTGRKSKKRRS